MISLIAAIQKKDRGLGFNNELLFRISDDLKRFKALTIGHPIIMGRKTFDSIGKALPNRTNIVVSRNTSLKTEGVIYCSSVEAAIAEAKKVDDEIFVIGGGEIYRQALPYAEGIYLTVVEADLPADTFFPAYDQFLDIRSEEYRADEKTGLKYAWIDVMLS